MRILFGKDEIPKPGWSVRFLWEPRDMWVGVFWNVVDVGHPDGTLDPIRNFYTCLIPCLPLVFSWRKLP